MKNKNLLIVIIVILGLAVSYGCTSTENSKAGQTELVQKPAQVSTPTSTPTPTQTDKQTKTLADKEQDSNSVATQTSSTKETPTSVSDSTSQTQQIAESAPIELSGSGQKATKKFKLEQGLSEFSMTYHGSDNFIVWLMDGNTGENVELLANEIGSFSGSKAVGITSDGDYILNVQSSGPWTVTIKQPRQPATQSAPLTLQGTGQQASEMFSLDEGLKTFTMKHNGSQNFIVWLMDDKGNKVDLLANDIGSFDGSKAVRIPQTGTYLLDIAANGKWEVSIE